MSRLDSSFPSAQNNGLYIPKRRLHGPLFCVLYGTSGRKSRKEKKTIGKMDMGFYTGIRSWSHRRPS